MNKNISIAIVDDHTLFRKGLAGLINEIEGYSVVADCENGLVFEQILATGLAVDIVLLDIMMPGRNGFETATFLRDKYPSIQILALSTMDHEASIIRMIKSGANGYLLKDTDIPELKMAFTELLEEGFHYNKHISKKMMRSLSELLDNKSNLHHALALNDNELQFLQLACSDKSYQQIAAEMHKSEKTIDGYRADLFKKFQVSSRVGLVIYAIKSGLVGL
jgi:DNA-binding NarL/FixJ family response regulator